MRSSTVHGRGLDYRSSPEVQRDGRGRVHRDPSDLENMADKLPYYPTGHFPSPVMGIDAEAASVHSLVVDSFDMGQLVAGIYAAALPSRRCMYTCRKIPPGPD